MKTLKTLAFASTLAMLSLAASAQSILVMTTLSGAVSDSGVRTFTLASATGVNAPSAFDPTKSTILYVDREAMDVEGVSGNNVTVIRGAESTATRSHASGALVFVIPAYLATFMGGGGYGLPPAVPSGSCIRTTELVLPRIQFASGTISDCLGGQWVNGDITGSQRSVSFRIPFPNSGGTAYTSLNTNGTTLVSGTLYCSEMSFPYSKYLTGLGVLNGTTVGTDKHLVALLDNAGTVVATSALAGATSSGASTYQTYAFTTPYFAVGPGQYFGCVQSNGTTDTVRMIVTGAQDTYLTTSKTGTFGTIPAITVPTVFTTAVGPYMELY